MVRFLFDQPISIDNGSWSSFEAASSIIIIADDTKIFKTINSKSNALSLCTERSVKFP